MANVKLEKVGYGQIELNRIAAKNSGAIETQCALAASFTEANPAENGMFLAVDKANGKIEKYAAGKTLPMALMATVEKLYDPLKGGLKDFKMVSGNDNFLPRLYFLGTGDTFTTNTVMYDAATYADVKAFIAALKTAGTTQLYGKKDVSGYWVVGATAADATALVVKGTTMPDGQLAVKFIVL